jgi:hypothetical protein
MTLAANVGANSQFPWRVGIGVVGVAAIDAVLDREKPVIRLCSEGDLQRAVERGPNLDAAGRDLVAVVDVVG